MRSLFLIPIVFSFMTLVNAQDFSGNYESNTASGKITLALKTSQSGSYTGTLSGSNGSIALNGLVRDGKLVGVVGETGSNIIFNAVVQGGTLTFTMADSDYNGNINNSTAQVLSFVRSSGNQAVPAPGGYGPATVQSKNEVRINNIPLTSQQVTELTARYGVEPRPGNYWYDPVSGLFGAYGYASFGFMYPGHNFGKPSRSCSGGNTGVLINGRELPQQEWAIWSSIIGYYVQPGSYWFDSQGNVGYEGINIPVLNMFTIARQNSYSGQGGGGDNFWSSRFGAGNSNADNSQGYVSVPGYGPVGYGF